LEVLTNLNELNTLLGTASQQRKKKRHEIYNLEHQRVCLAALKSVARELAKCNSDSLVQEVSRTRVALSKHRIIHFAMKNGMIIMIIHNMMRPAAERIEFVCNRMACTKRSLV
jgi:hypothetical protein